MFKKTKGEIISDFKCSVNSFSVQWYICISNQWTSRSMQNCK